MPPKGISHQIHHRRVNNNNGDGYQDYFEPWPH
jgi:hypothetical protein